MTPEQIARSGTESAHQRAVFAWAALNREKYPELEHLMFHIPNGGSRGGNARSRKIRGGNLKAEGVKPFVPDIFISVARHDVHGLYIEMKKPGEKPKKGQREWGDAVKKQGYGWMYCDNWESAVEAITLYMEEI